MPTYRDEGVVLRTHKLGEADRIITVLTQRHGKVRAVGKGVRRTSSKFGGRLEPFSHIDAQFVQGRSLDVVAQVEQLHAYGEPLVGRYAAYTAGHVMLECADKLVVEEQQPALRHYRLLLGGLRTLGHGTSDGARPATLILDSFLLRALSIAGYAPALVDCATCGAPGPHAGFSPSAGGVVCPSCRPPGTVRPEPETLHLLGALLAGEWERTRAVPPPVRRQAAGLTTAFVNWHLENRLRSLPLVERDLDAPSE